MANWVSPIRDFAIYEFASYGSSSVGRAVDSKSTGRGFESSLPCFVRRAPQAAGP